MGVQGTAIVGSLGRRAGRSGSRTRGRREEEAFSSIADFLGAFMWQADGTTLAITFMTGGVKDLTGHAASEWIGPTERWTQLIDGEERDAVVEYLRAAASEGLDRQGAG